MIRINDDSNNFYPQGAKWEWSGETKGDWHIYPMVKLTQAEVATMIRRREERRNLAIEEIEKRNNIKNKKEKKRPIKSKDRGLPRIEGKKAVRKLMNSFLGKDHENNCLVSKIIMTSLLTLESGNWNFTPIFPA